MIDRRQIKNWLCEDCTFVFQTFGKKQNGRPRKYFCPSCGENISVVKYEADRFNQKGPKRIYQPWTDEEMKIIERVMDGELLKYQAAIKLGRSIKSVRRRIERLNEERNAQLEQVNQ
ncbi:hypothetical protein IIE26_05090 [Cytobacillus oceanisediminis]|uniref:hypothetical protein n=1 Tax=Cytobacillus oceanisediminis TaxID=665099 RepID=UPI001864BC11|nr:hypothetical protein [Cytobacillus oceanisediminis]QOK28047.1 hypothetical protein IIE26_05090 [Cytobacillus oceanisediminis]